MILVIISQIGSTGKKTTFFGPVARENPGKNQEIKYKTIKQYKITIQVGTGKRMFPYAWDGKFPGFFQEISGSREMPFGNADLYFHLLPLTVGILPPLILHYHVVNPILSRCYLFLFLLWLNGPRARIIM